MSSRRGAIDVDGDEFMKPAEEQKEPQTGNKFARPTGHSATYSPMFDFSTETKSFDKQYAAIYFSRLQRLKRVVLKVAEAALPGYGHLTSSSGEKPRVCEKVLDISPDRYCVIAGTVYKEMKLKPCILDEYNKAAGAAVAGAAGAAEKYTSADDSLILEDEFGRVSLTGSASVMDPRTMASGVVVAVLGREVAGGKFEVEAMFLPGLAPQKPLADVTARALAATQPTSAAPAYVLCVSGLSFGTPGADPMPVQLLMDYITGLLGSSADQASSARIIRVLVAGNSLHRFEKKKALGRDFAREEVDAAEVAQPLKELDVMLTQLAAAVPVDILPGEQDPSNFTLPQQPFHRCLFPSASTYSTFKATTNPTWLEIGELQVCATSGQNINDLAKYSDAASNIGYLENTMRWRNVAPTAPDTLGCYPYQGKDPFVLDVSPHLYVVGGQDKYESKLVKENGVSVRLIALPAFVKTGTAVLVDVNSPTLEAQSISFKVQQPMEM